VKSSIESDDPRFRYDALFDFHEGNTGVDPLNLRCPCDSALSHWKLPLAGEHMKECKNIRVEPQSTIDTTMAELFDAILHGWNQNTSEKP